MIRLSALPLGSSGIIRRYENDDIHLKLMEMGCVPGERVRVEKIAPLGDPISISVAGYQLSLRKMEADNVWVDELVSIH
jgi:ferrous iron transport protein A